MLNVNDYEQDIAASLLDFFDRRTPWQRCLWMVGTVMSLRETAEGAEALQHGHLSPAAYGDLCATTERIAGNDPACGDEAQRRLLQSTLSEKPAAGSVSFNVLADLTERIDNTYLDTWSRLVVDVESRPSSVVAAQYIAAHLLDSGFSKAHLHEWWRNRVKREAGSRTLSDILEEAHADIRSGETTHRILVALGRAPAVSEAPPPNWLSSADTSQWIRSNGSSTSGLRVAGGMVLEVRARDPISAVDFAMEQIDRTAARVQLGSRDELKLAELVFVEGKREPVRLHPHVRGVEVGSLRREGRMYVQPNAGALDAALALVRLLDSGPPASAVAGGWAALEALLLGPGDSKMRRVAGDRLATIVACSYPRAEMTMLAYKHSNNAEDTLARAIRVASCNRDRANLAAAHVEAMQPLQLLSRSDKIAETRMRALLVDPKAELRTIERTANEALRRLYRHRNVVLHWGRINAVALKATLRTVAPIVGAGMDRVSHCLLAEQIGPLELAARAKIRLDTVGFGSGCSPLELLEGTPTR